MSRSMAALKQVGADLTDQDDNRDYDLEISQTVANLNKKYALVNEAGKTVIFKFGFDRLLKRQHIDRISIRDFSAMYMNDRLVVGKDDKDRPVYKTRANIWLNHRERRQYIEGVVFDPSTTNAEPGILNLWQGFAVTPARGDWSIMRSHIQQIICDGDDVRFQYLMGWMARMVQKPAEQGEVAVVLKGGEGTGKGTLARVLLKIIGQHGLAVSNAKHLVGNFNGHLRDAVLLFADEAFFAGDRAHVGVLKAIITEPYLTVEAKHQNAVQMPNFLHVIMASNEQWVVPASLDARRFFVLDVAEAAKNDHAYFASIWAQMDAGGYGAMLHELLAMDLSAFNVRAVPITEGLQQQRKLSLGVADAWWKDCLERGYVFRSKLGLEEHFQHWHDEVSTELLYTSYQEFSRDRRDKDPLSREQFGRFMSRMGGAAKRLSNCATGEHMTDISNPYGGSSRGAKPIMGERPYGYRVGTLIESRQWFEDALGLRVEWPGA